MIKIRLGLLLVHSASLILLALGWIKDLLTINISAHFVVDINLFNETKSVFGLLKNLWNSSNYIPFFLLLLFGIIVPIVKSILIYILILSKNVSIKWYQFVSVISKWAMADVFVVSILVAFLSASAMQSTTAKLQIGFYYFSGYVIVSAVLVAFLGRILKKDNTEK